MSSTQHKIDIWYLEGTPTIQDQPGLYGTPPLETTQTLGSNGIDSNGRFFYWVSGLRKVTSEELFWSWPWSVLDADMTEDTFVQVGFPDDWKPNGYIEVESENGFLRVTSSATSEWNQWNGFKVIYLAYY